MKQDRQELSDAQFFVTLACFLFVGVLLIGSFCYALWNRNPRVVKCKKCGTVEGLIGANLPMQHTKCSCGGSIAPIRKLTYAEWEDAEKRGYVTELDGRAYR